MQASLGRPGKSSKEAGRLALNPRTHQLRRNFIFNRNFLGDTHSGYAIDYDDGKCPPAPWP